MADGPFVEDWEFSSVIGVERKELRKLFEDKSALDLEGDAAWIAKNCVNNLIGYPHGMDDLLQHRFGLTQPELENLWSDLAD
ncbi:MAG: hypothetical protein RIG84_06500 [Roseovarius sp.]